jgi:hypothetical protein
MADNEALFSALFGSMYRLPKTIPAIQTSFAQDGRAELGAISHLPEAAELTFCGEGFNDSTLKVRWEGQLYFVFLEDLAPAEPGISDLVNGRPRKPNQSQPLRQLAASHVA